MVRKKKKAKNTISLSQPVPAEVVALSSLANVETLMSMHRPAFRTYPDAFFSSRDFTEKMDKTEQASYFLMLLSSWTEPIQCFLPFTLEDLRTSCRVTEHRFVKMWNHILSKKFKFATHEGNVYIYNPRLLKEWKIAQKYSESGSAGGIKRAINAGQEVHVAKLHTFNKSPFYVKATFTAALKAEEGFEHVDHGHYYEKVKAWSQGNTRGNWLDQGKVFVLNSIEKKELKLLSGVKPFTRKKIEQDIVNKKQNYHL